MGTLNSTVRRAVRAVRAVVRYARYARRDRSAGYARRHRRTGHPRRDRHERETENQSELCERGREGEERWNFLIAHSCEIKKVIDKKLKARRRSRTCAHETNSMKIPYTLTTILIIVSKKGASAIQHGPRS